MFQSFIFRAMLVYEIYCTEHCNLNSGLLSNSLLKLGLCVQEKS